VSLFEELKFYHNLKLDVLLAYGSVRSLKCEKLGAGSEICVFLPEPKGNHGEDCDAFRVCTVKMLSTNTTALICTFTI
jgi:hypothetical protein